MKKKLKSRLYFYLTDLVHSNLRLKGFRVEAQYVDILLTLFINGFRINDSSTRFEIRALRVEKRKRRARKF